MKLYMQDFVEPKPTKDEICDALQEVSYEDKKFIKKQENFENRNTLPDNIAIYKQRGALSKQQQISRKQTLCYKKNHVKRKAICYALQMLHGSTPS